MTQRRCAVLVATAILTPTLPSAKGKLPPTVAEWGQFEQLVTQARGGLSPDGKWLAYGINRSSRDNDLRIRHLGSGTEKTIAFGAGPVFSADSKWVAYSIGYSEREEERMRTQRRPIHRKLGLIKLDGASDPITIDGIESFSVDPGGSFIVMRRYAPERPAAGGAGAPAGATPPGSPPAPPSTSGDDPPPTGVTVIVRHLESGRDTTFGNVSEFAWQNVSEPAKLQGRLLALIISAEGAVRDGPDHRTPLG